MSTDSIHKELSMANGTIYSIADAADVQVICRKGCIWVTLDGDPRDIVLGAEESFSAGEHCRALLYALEASDIILCGSERPSFLARFGVFGGRPAQHDRHAIVC